MLKDKILIIQYLRGIAALGVVFCHFGSGLSFYPTLSSFFNFGQSGVFVFFLISGFIIVYSLIKSRYRIQEFLTFLFKRSARIDPPYIVVILLTLLLFDILSFLPSFKGHRIVFIPQQFIAHIFYAIPFTRYPYYNSIFWTLSVEFQFYLLVGLLFFISDNAVYKCVFLIFFSLTSFIPFANGSALVFNYAPIFSLGIAVLIFYMKRDWINIILPLLLLGLIEYKFGYAICLLLGITCLAVLNVRFIFKPLELLGNISYSLYLTHPVVLIVVFGIAKKLQIDTDRNQLTLLLIEVITAVVCAYGFFLAIERPSINLSKRIKYGTSAKIKGSSKRTH